LIRHAFRGNDAAMKRIELELYADRISRHAERLRDEIDGARTRIAWARFEHEARASLGQHDGAVLEALGVFAGADELAERRLLDRRIRQLAIVERYQAVVERTLSEASDAISPPSSS
jgi:hypothetical protein